MMKKVLYLLAFVSLLAGCDRAPRAQFTSGQSYLKHYEDDAAAVQADRKKNLDKSIRLAASIEPILSLPARIGVVRIENGNLSDIPPHEAEEWQRISDHNEQLGEFVFVNVLGTAGINEHYSRWRWEKDNHSSIESLRVSAARQHLDVILIYEINSKARRFSTPLAVADLTLVGGALLPTRSITVNSNARALLVDVRNGYPYGSASAVSEFDKLSTTWGREGRQEKLRRQGIEETFYDLTPKVEEMFTELQTKVRNR